MRFSSGKLLCFWFLKQHLMALDAQWLSPKANYIWGVDACYVVTLCHIVCHYYLHTYEPACVKSHPLAHDFNCSQTRMQNYNK